VHASSHVRRLELLGPPSVTWTDERGSVLSLLQRGSWQGEVRELIVPAAVAH
jgi:hypothetical protein